MRNLVVPDKIEGEEDEEQKSILDIWYYPKPEIRIRNLNPDAKAEIQNTRNPKPEI